MHIIFGQLVNMHYTEGIDGIYFICLSALLTSPKLHVCITLQWKDLYTKFTAYFTGPKVVKPQKSTVPVPSFQSSVSRPASSTAVPGKKRSVARKSTTGSSQSNQSIVSSSPMSEGELQMSKWEAPWLKKRQPATNTNAGTKKSRGKGQVEIV